jgi:DMSO/TMAO reductase YedYZ molybdopterin-dependent catalytic subunit
MKQEDDSLQHDTKMPGNGGKAKADSNGDGGDQKKPEPKLSPAFEAAFAALKKAQGNKRPRGQEEAGESDNTLDPNTPGLLLTMDDVTSLPHHELVTEFKCIEGWSQVVHWGGYRLADLIAKYPPARNADGSLPKYVYMETPDGDYYCGFNLQVCQHPQSLLATEMAGQPLTQLHGAPVRLHMPIKYGYKQIKRIGLIVYTDMQPDDYWTKLGYDWYAGI